MKKNGLHVDTDGTKCWYKDGLIHREDGPAIIYKDGAQYWYKNGKYHRDDGPAAICRDGSQYWLKNGKYHRDDGPAIIYPNGKHSWYKDDIMYIPTAHEIMTWKMNEKSTAHW